MTCTKKKFTKRYSAWQASLKYLKYLGHFLTPYTCPKCGKYHLTGKQANEGGLPDWYRIDFNEWFGMEVL